MEQTHRRKPKTATRIPVLITSSIIPHDSGVKLSDPQKRLFHALESIEQWIRVAPGSKLVLCDGSNFDFRPIIKEKFPCVEVECLFFENDRLKIIAYGRGYGEGEIVKFALNNSEFLNRSDAFAKCSSKLWVENYPECLGNWRDECLFSGVFNNIFSIAKPIEMIQVDTRFYISNVQFYLTNLIEAHQKIGKSVGFGLEDSFHEILIKKNQKRYLFPSPPIIKGVGGGTGEYYKDTQLRVLKEKLRFSFARRSLEFRDLFAFK